MTHTYSLPPSNKEGSPRPRFTSGCCSRGREGNSWDSLMRSREGNGPRLRALLWWWLLAHGAAHGLFFLPFILILSLFLSLCLCLFLFFSLCLFLSSLSPSLSLVYFPRFLCLPVSLPLPLSQPHTSRPPRNASFQVTYVATDTHNLPKDVHLRSWIKLGEQCLQPSGRNELQPEEVNRPNSGP